MGGCINITCIKYEEKETWLPATSWTHSFPAVTLHVEVSVREPFDLDILFCGCKHAQWHSKKLECINACSGYEWTAGWHLESGKALSPKDLGTDFSWLSRCLLVTWFEILGICLMLHSSTILRLKSFYLHSTFTRITFTSLSSWYRSSTSSASFGLYSLPVSTLEPSMVLLYSGRSMASAYSSIAWCPTVWYM